MRGSIIQKTKKGKWYIVVDYYDTNGKRKRKWFSGYRLRKDAQADLPRVLKMMNDNQYVETHGLTVKEFFEDQLKTQAKILKKTTLQSYKNFLYNHLVSIHNIKLQNLKTIHLQNVYDDLIQKDFSSKSIYNINGYVHKVLSNAVTLGLICYNPADAIIKPKKLNKDINTYSKETMDIVLNHLKDTEMYLPILLLFHTGMRRGELLGLKYQDVDLTNNVISIKRTRMPHGLDTPKNSSSYRDIAISEDVKQAIIDNINIQKQNEDSLGNKYQKNDFVIKANDGTIRSIGYLARRFTKICKELELPHLRIHDLRHSSATYLVSKGVNLKIVQDRLGHSTINTTANIYSHPNIDAQKNAIQNLF